MPLALRRAVLVGILLATACAQVEDEGARARGDVAIRPQPEDGATRPDRDGGREVIDGDAPRDAAGHPTDGDPVPTDGARPPEDARARVDAQPGDSGPAGPDGCDELPFDALPLCIKSVGVCQGARQRCEAGRIRACLEPDYEAYSGDYVQSETDAHCDGLDNDCDGLVDEACACGPGEGLACGSGVGGCRPGIQRCRDGAWGACEGDVGPLPEVCNGLDDDCNGLVDDDLTDEAPRCEQQDGVCEGALRPCGGADGWLPCDEALLSRHDARYTPVETDAHCNGLDDDCDGRTDEACDCGPGDERACGSSVGECRAGTQRCEGERFTECDGAGPRAEACDNRDNDCDGRVDEGELCAARHGCIAGGCQRVSGVWSATSPALGHDVGVGERGGWCAATANFRPGFLVYGPYVRDLAAGEYEVVWSLLIDNNQADNNQVARLEVNDFDRRPECGDCLITTRTLRRREFTNPLAWQDFSVRFSNPGGRRLEFRIHWTDIAYLCVRQIEARRVGP